LFFQQAASGPGPGVGVNFSPVGAAFTHFGERQLHAKKISAL
jgi:hypothetical protein